MKKGFMLLMTALCACCLMYFTSTATDLTQGPVHIVKVKAGDTLWDIAAAASGPDVDIRDVIHATQELNHLDHSAEIRPGMVLKVPVTAKDNFSSHTYVSTR